MTFHVVSESQHLSADLGCCCEGWMHGAQITLQRGATLEIAGAGLDVWNVYQSTWEVRRRLVDRIQLPFLVNFARLANPRVQYRSPAAATTFHADNTEAHAQDVKVYIADSLNLPSESTFPGTLL